MFSNADNIRPTTEQSQKPHRQNENVLRHVCRRMSRESLVVKAAPYYINSCDIVTSVVPNKVNPKSNASRSFCYVVLSLSLLHHHVITRENIPHCVLPGSMNKLLIEIQITSSLYSRCINDAQILSGTIIRRVGDFWARIGRKVMTERVT